MTVVEITRSKIDYNFFQIVKAGNIMQQKHCIIRKAIPQDIDQVERSYVELLLHEQEHGAYTAWKLGVYPTRETVEKSFTNGHLYVMEQDGEICASIILNQICPKEYDNIKWKYHAQSTEILVVHLLCVRPSKARCGIGKDMVQFAIREGIRLNCKTIRLDTGAQNKPAVELYQKLGFELAGTTAMNIGGLIAHNNHLFFEKNIRN